MAIRGTTQTQLLDLEVSGRIVFDVRDARWVTLQTSVVTGAWGATVLTVQRGNNRWDWGAMESATTLTASGITNELDVEGFAFLSVYPSTLAGAAGKANITLCAKTEV